MRFVDEVSEQGVTERRFELEVGGERIPGILWHPTAAKGPRPLLLQGHGARTQARAGTSWASLAAWSGITATPWRRSTHPATVIG